MKTLLLLPILAYLGLMLVNMDLLTEPKNINLFGVQAIEVPVLIWSSVFIVLYPVLVYLVYAGVNGLQSYKIKKLEKEIVGLKSDLYNNQKDLLATISKEYTEQFKAFKKDNDAKMETIVRFNEYTLEKVLTETAGDFSKYRKETQKLLSNTKGIDTGILEDLKLWK